MSSETRAKLWRRSWFWVAVAVLVCLAAVVFTYKVSCVPRFTTVNDSANGSTVTLDIYLGYLIVELESNPTTGYRWELTSISDPAVLDNYLHRYEAPTTEITGAAGKEVWGFRPLKTGNSTLNLEYKRPGSSDAAKTFSLTVKVK